MGHRKSASNYLTLLDISCGAPLDTVSNCPPAAGFWNAASAAQRGTVVRLTTSFRSLLVSEVTWAALLVAERSAQFAVVCNPLVDGCGTSVSRG
jgi:hypothetical protein